MRPELAALALVTSQATNREAFEALPPGVPSGTSQYDVAADTTTNLGSTATHFVVYQKTRIAEETTPAALAISDTGIQAQQVQFTDYDLDVNQLGGDILWQEPALDTNLISEYLVAR